MRRIRGTTSHWEYETDYLSLGFGELDMSGVVFVFNGDPLRVGEGNSFGDAPGLVGHRFSDDVDVPRVGAANPKPEKNISLVAFTNICKEGPSVIIL